MKTKIKKTFTLGEAWIGPVLGTEYQVTSVSKDTGVLRLEGGGSEMWTYDTFVELGYTLKEAG